MSNSIPLFGFATAPPIDPREFYPKGSRLSNSEPAVGTPEGWVCIEGGYPGTWIVTNIIGANSVADAFYFGSPTTNGTWRIAASGDNLVVQRRESGVWVAKTNFEP